MKKKNGFISMTLVYTFLILFMFLMLAILRTYTEKDKFLQAINDQIDTDISSAKKSRSTIINRIIEDNMPISDKAIKYYKISNKHYGNGGSFYYMDNKSYDGYNLSMYTDENADGHTSKIYYYRGHNDNNHIVFANKCFRIIRTNEDGSIRVIYNGPTSGSASNPKCSTLDDLHDNSVSVSIGSAKYNDSSSVVYSVDSNNESPIIQVLNEWYIDSFFPNDTNQVNYTDFISRDTVFCNNKTFYNNSGDTGYYQSRELSPIFIDSKDKDRYNDSNIKNIISFYCENPSDRFSVIEGNLVYPIGLPTAQDVVLAGGYLYLDDIDDYDGGPNSTIENTDYYMFSEEGYWTMSPLSSNKIIYVDNEGVLKAGSPSDVRKIRPVISLNSNITIKKGTGTQNNPYIVKTSE